MFQKSIRSPRVARWLAGTATAIILAVALCSCQTAGDDVTGSLGEKSDVKRSADPRRDVELAQARFKANPKDAEAALQYGKALRAAGQRAQAVAVLEQATSPIPATRRCSPATAARWRTMAISSRPLRCSAAPTAPKIRTGGSCRRRARPWISSAGTRKRGSIMRAR